MFEPSNDGKKFFSDCVIKDVKLLLVDMILDRYKGDLIGCCRPGHL